MGFGFNIVFIFILLPLVILICILWVFNRKAIWGRLLLLIAVGVIVLIVSVSIAQQIMKKKVLSKKDYYGSYIINRNYFAGKQANWQYNHYRFDIKENDTLYFYVTNKEKILKTYAYNISTTNSYESARLFLNSDTLAHHIIAKPPTTIRTAWNFNLVFHSAQYNNMYFKKGQWKPIEEN
jgi:hypothetical protein